MSNETDNKVEPGFNPSNEEQVENKLENNETKTDESQDNPDQEDQKTEEKEPINKLESIDNEEREKEERKAAVAENTINSNLKKVKEGIISADDLDGWIRDGVNEKLAAEKDVEKISVSAKKESLDSAFKLINDDIKDLDTKSKFLNEYTDLVSKYATRSDVSVKDIIDLASKRAGVSQQVAEEKRQEAVSNATMPARSQTQTPNGIKAVSLKEYSRMSEDDQRAYRKSGLKFV